MGPIVCAFGVSRHPPWHGAFAAAEGIVWHHEDAQAPSGTPSFLFWLFQTARLLMRRAWVLYREEHTGSSTMEPGKYQKFQCMDPLAFTGSVSRTRRMWL